MTQINESNLKTFCENITRKNYELEKHNDIIINLNESLNRDIINLQNEKNILMEENKNLQQENKNLFNENISLLSKRDMTKKNNISSITPNFPEQINNLKNTIEQLTEKYKKVVQNVNELKDVNNDVVNNDVINNNVNIKKNNIVIEKNNKIDSILLPKKSVLNNNKNFNLKFNNLKKINNLMLINKNTKNNEKKSFFNIGDKLINDTKKSPIKNINNINKMHNNNNMLNNKKSKINNLLMMRAIITKNKGENINNLEK
jgi:hypothetical protein